jgi:hypothetical protein
MMICTLRRIRRICSRIAGRMSAPAARRSLKQRLCEISDLNSAGGVLNWWAKRPTPDHVARDRSQRRC